MTEPIGGGEAARRPLRLVFMGTAELACASLRALAAQPDFHVLAVVTQPDRPKGRDLKLQPSAVKAAALELNLPVLQPERARNETFIAQLRDLQTDLMVVVAYGQILPPAILALPRFGCLNVHTSLLPKYRGAAPIQWAILNGDAETGVTIMQMDAGLDTGPSLARTVTPILPTDDSQTLHDRLARLGAELLPATIRGVAAGAIRPEPQPVAGVSIARKITKTDGALDWRGSAHALWCRARAFTPWPGVYTHLPAPDGEAPGPLLKVWQTEVVAAAGAPGEILRADKEGILVGCGEGALRLLVVQREGGKRLAAGAFLAGCPLAAGQRLGGAEGPA